MSIGSLEHALLAKDSYVDRLKDQVVSIGNARYKILGTTSNPVTGYQGTVYQRVNASGVPTGDVVIAHRGTEKDARDVGTDVGMVLNGLNAQAADAEAFTKHAIELAKNSAEKNHTPLDITVTGHSLGGTLAELTAYKFHLRGETFNAYGAAGLMHGVPEGGLQVINYVRATDVVSAASKHFGETRVLTTAQDIDTLSRAGYRDDGGVLSARNPIKAVDLEAHGIANFVPDALGRSALDPENAVRYRAHHSMVDRYRDDMLTSRTVVSAPWEVGKAGVDTGLAISHAGAHRLTETYKTAREATVQAANAVAHAAEQVDHAVSQTYDVTHHAVNRGLRSAEQKAQQAGDAIGRGAQAAQEISGQTARALGDGASRTISTLRHPGSWFDTKTTASTPPAPRLDQPTHPGHAMFQQARDGVHQLDARNGRTPDQRSDNLAAALVVPARSSGMDRIDHVDLATDASKVFAVQGALGSPFKQIASVPTVEALDTSVAQSTQALNQAMQHKPQEQLHQHVQQQAASPGQQRTAPAM